MSTIKTLARKEYRKKQERLLEKYAFGFISYNTYLNSLQALDVAFINEEKSTKGILL